MPLPSTQKATDALLPSLTALPKHSPWHSTIIRLATMSTTSSATHGASPSPPHLLGEECVPFDEDITMTKDETFSSDTAAAPFDEAKPTRRPFPGDVLSTTSTDSSSSSSSSTTSSDEDDDDAVTPSCSAALGPKKKNSTMRTTTLLPTKQPNLYTSFADGWDSDDDDDNNMAPAKDLTGAQLATSVSPLQTDPSLVSSSSSSTAYTNQDDGDEMTDTIRDLQQHLRALMPLLLPSQPPDEQTLQEVYEAVDEQIDMSDVNGRGGDGIGRRRPVSIQHALYHDKKPAADTSSLPSQFCGLYHHVHHDDDSMSLQQPFDEQHVTCLQHYRIHVPFCRAQTCMYCARPRPPTFVSVPRGARAPRWLAGTQWWMLQTASRRNSPSLWQSIVTSWIDGATTTLSKHDQDHACATSMAEDLYSLD